MAELPKDDVFGMLGFLFFATVDNESYVPVTRGKGVP
jgi:hypothetical protein